MNCEKCGALLDESGKCTNCGSADSTVADKQAKKHSHTKKKRRGKKILAVILALIITFSGCTCALVYFEAIDIPFVSDLMVKLGIINKDDFDTITGKFTDISIVDESSAITAAKEAVNKMGLENAADELSVKNVTEADGLTYYRLQQNYQNIPVDGKTIIVVADDSGNAKSAFSNMSDIEIKNFDKELDDEKIISKAASFLSEEEENIKLLSSNKIILGEDQLYTAYDATFSCGDTIYTLYIPIGNQKVTYPSTEVNPTVLRKNVVCKNSNGMTFNGIQITEKLLNKEVNPYVLYDYGEKMYCLNANGKSTFSFSSHSDIKNSAKKMQNNFTNRFGKDSTVAFVAYNNLKKIKNYYIDKFNDYGYNGLAIIINSGTGTVGGKAKVSAFDDLKLANYDGEYIGCVQIGAYTDEPEKALEDASSIATMGHEYTHVITRNKVNWSYTLDEAAEASCINEAYSDLFGMIIEAQINDTPNNLSWNFRADVKTLENGLYPSKVNSYKSFQLDIPAGGGSETVKNWSMVWLDEDANKYDGYSYAYAVTLEYAAYLMTASGNSSGNLTISELSKLWYNTMCTLHSNANFAELRKNMEITADNLGYSDAKKKNIASAFDKIGIESQNEEDTTENSSTQAKSLAATNKDFKKFENYISECASVHFDNDFDLEKITTADIISKYLARPIALSNGSSYSYFYGECERYNKNDEDYSSSSIVDPKGLFIHAEMLEADKADWIIKNVFEKTPDHSLSSKVSFDLETNRWRGGYYYQGNYLYISYAEGDGEEPSPKIIEKYQLSDGNYGFVVLTDYGSDSSTKTSYYVAKLKEDENIGRYWCILKGSKDKPCFEIPDKTIDFLLESGFLKNFDFKNLSVESVLNMLQVQFGIPTGEILRLFYKYRNDIEEFIEWIMEYFEE